MIKIFDSNNVTKIYFSSESEMKELYNALKDHFENAIKPDPMYTNETCYTSNSASFLNGIDNNRKIK